MDITDLRIEKENEIFECKECHKTYFLPQLVDTYGYAVGGEVHTFNYEDQGYCFECYKKRNPVEVGMQIGLTRLFQFLCVSSFFVGFVCTIAQQFELAKLMLLVFAVSFICGYVVEMTK